MLHYYFFFSFALHCQLFCDVAGSVQKFVSSTQRSGSYVFSDTRLNELCNIFNVPSQPAVLGMQCVIKTKSEGRKKCVHTGN